MISSVSSPSGRCSCSPKYSISPTKIIPSRVNARMHAFRRQYHFHSSAVIIGSIFPSLHPNLGRPPHSLAAPDHDLSKKPDWKMPPLCCGGAWMAQRENGTEPRGREGRFGLGLKRIPPGDHSISFRRVGVGSEGSGNFLTRMYFNLFLRNAILRQFVGASDFIYLLDNQA